MRRAQESGWLAEWAPENLPPQDDPHDLNLALPDADDLHYASDLTFLPPDVAFDDYQHGSQHTDVGQDSYASQDMQDGSGLLPGEPARGEVFCVLTPAAGGDRERHSWC